MEVPADYSRIQERMDLTDLTTFGVPWKADYGLVVTEREHVRDGIGFAKANNLTMMVLGGGSNVLATKRFKGLVMVNRLAGRSVVSDSESEIVLEINSGENWHETVLFCVEKGYHGFENLALIPGTVGGAVVQNIGAYDQQIDRLVRSVLVVDLETGEEREFAAGECEFAYRNSLFKGSDRYMVMSVRFVLSREYEPITTYKGLRQELSNMDANANDPKAGEVTEAVMKLREEKLPDWELIGTAGSFFANPRVEWKEIRKLKKRYPTMPVFSNDETSEHTVPAGWLIEHCSLDHKLREQFLSDNHALVLVNRYKGATDQPQKYGKQIEHVAHKIANIVKREFGISLRPEVLTI